MKKKVVKKSRAVRSVASKKTGKSKWFKTLPFKFSILSVTILGCLTLVALGAYHFAPKTDVLGANIARPPITPLPKNKPCILITSKVPATTYNQRPQDDAFTRKCEWGLSQLASGYYYNTAGCTPEGPDADINSGSYTDLCSHVNHTIFVKFVNANNKNKLTLYKSVGINVSGHLPEHQMPDPPQGKVQVITSKGITYGITHFDNQYGAVAYENAIVITPAGAAANVYKFSPTSIKVSPGLSGIGSADCGDQSNPCVFTVKIVVPTPKPTIKPAPKVKTQSVVPKPAPKTACPSSKGFCTSARSCKADGGHANSAYTCSKNAVCCTQ